VPGPRVGRANVHTERLSQSIDWDQLCRRRGATWASPRAQMVPQCADKLECQISSSFWWGSHAQIGNRHWDGDAYAFRSFRFKCGGDDTHRQHNHSAWNVPLLGQKGGLLATRTSWSVRDRAANGV